MLSAVTLASASTRWPTRPLRRARREASRSAERRCAPISRGLGRRAGSSRRRSSVDAGRAARPRRRTTRLARRGDELDAPSRGLDARASRTSRGTWTPRSPTRRTTTGSRSTRADAAVLDRVRVPCAYARSEAAAGRGTAARRAARARAADAASRDRELRARRLERSRGALARLHLMRGRRRNAPAHSGTPGSASPGVRTLPLATPRRGASGPPRATAASSATGSRSGGCARASR